jgi:transposase
MTNVNVFTGFDVSKDYFDFCILDDQGIVSSQRILYTRQGLKSLLGKIPGVSHCIMEATGPYYLRLASWLFQNGFKVSVVNPLVIRRFCQMKLTRAKTDKTDAKMIAWYGKTERPAAWEPPAEYIVRLQQLDAIADLLIKNRTAFYNQLEAFNATGMLDAPTRSLLNKSIASTTKKLHQIELRITEIINEHHKQMLSNLTSIPGIGKKSAIALIVVTGGFNRFSNYKQLTSYLGISPRIYESGTSVKGRSRICKLGMSRIRAMLYVCAWSAKKCNHACKQLYDRLVEKGKSKKLALIAVANKLIKQAFAIAMSGIKYQPA